VSAADEIRSGDAQLATLTKALRRRWPVVVLIPLMAIAVALVLSLSATKKYEASSKVYINQQNPVQNALDTTSQTPSDPERDLNSRVDLITVQAVADRVRKQLRLNVSDSDLLNEVTPEVQGTSDIVAIRVRDTQPRRAAAIANAFATQYVATRLESARGAILQAAQLAQHQLASLSPADRAAPQGSQLAQRLRELQIAATLQTGGIEIVSTAKPSFSAVSPRPKLAAALAGVLGLIFAVLVALGLELLDTRIRESADLDPERPLLASIPPPRRPGADDDFGVREAYATLATNLRFLNLGRDVSSLVITSPGPREGKTTASLWLSRALAELGLRVITLEADLRRPMFSSYTNTQRASVGLSTVLAGITDLEDVIVDIDAATWQPFDGSATGTYFSVVPCGPVPPNPLGLLSSPEMADTVKRARASADVVVIDTPPVGAVNDAVTVAELVDGIAVVVKVGQSRREPLTRSLSVLDRLPTPVLGFILTNGPREDRSYYGYDKAHPVGVPT
jgi:capsular exopolysaccharide synthesis family protein